jgi:hypothetical protein
MFKGEPSTGGRVICETKRMPSLRSEREMRERREMQAVGQILTLSRLNSFPAYLAAGPACELMRPRPGVALSNRSPCLVAPRTKTASWAFSTTCQCRRARRVLTLLGCIGNRGRLVRHALSPQRQSAEMRSGRNCEPVQPARMTTPRGNLEESTEALAAPVPGKRGFEPPPACSPT